MTEAHGLLHGGETQVWCAGYQGVAGGEPGAWGGMADASIPSLCGSVGGEEQGIAKWSTRSLQFGYAKVRYRGLAKNTERLALLFGLGNLLTAEGQLTGTWAQWAKSGRGPPEGPVKGCNGPAGAQ